MSLVSLSRQFSRILEGATQREKKHEIVTNEEKKNVLFSSCVFVLAPFVRKFSFPIHSGMIVRKKQC